MQTLLIVLVLGCSPIFLGCNSVRQDQPLVEESPADGACDEFGSIALQQDPNQTPQDPALAPKPLFFNDILTVFTRPEYKCSTCHQDHYQDPEAIKMKWPKVIGSLESGFMPRGAKHVTPEDLALLRSWERAGFPRTYEDTQPKPSAAPRVDCSH